VVSWVIKDGLVGKGVLWWVVWCGVWLIVYLRRGSGVNKSVLCGCVLVQYGEGDGVRSRGWCGCV
jgi:hypothetical protein